VIHRTITTLTAQPQAEEQLDAHRMRAVDRIQERGRVIEGRLAADACPHVLVPDAAPTGDTVPVGDVQVLFDGVPAPLVFCWYYQVNVQVPYEVASRQTTSVQLIYLGIPSNVVQLAITPAAPGIFTKPAGAAEASLFNQDGSINGPLSPAARGSIVSIFATGAGQTMPPSITGAPAPIPLAAIPQLVTAAIGGRSAEVLYAGPAPGLVGVMQVNARVPNDVPVTSSLDLVSLAASVGTAASRSGVVLWVK
jgi:uncharacterized protein (TIGR03437 family)